MSCLPHILAKSNLGKQLGLTKDTAFNTIAEIRELIDSKGIYNNSKEQQNKTIKLALSAIEQGATLITDNKSYVESSDYNEGEKRLAKKLEEEGYNYSEQTIDGQVLGVWNKQKNITENNPSNIFKTTISNLNYELNTITGEVIQINKSDGKINKAQIKEIVKVYREYARINNFTEKSFNNQSYFKVFNKIINSNPANTTNNFIEDNNILNLFKEDNNTNISNNLQKSKNVIIPLNSNSTNDVIFEDENNIYLMNNDQQIAYNNIKNFVKEKYNNPVEITERTFNEKVIFNDFFSNQYSNIIPIELYNNMIGLQGFGGTGKTTLIKKIIKDIQNENGKKYNNFNVTFVAPTHIAVTQLQNSLGLDSESTEGVDTIASFLRNRPSGNNLQNEELFNPVSEKDYITSYKYKKPVGNTDLIVIDESSMISKKDIINLIDRLKTDFNSGKINKFPIILFLGDYHQLSPIENNNNLKLGIISSSILKNKEKSFSLSQMMRTKDLFLQELFTITANKIDEYLNSLENNTFTKLDLSSILNYIKISQQNLLTLEYNQENLNDLFDDYAKYLSENNLPDGMFYLHYNNINHSSSLHATKIIRQNYLNKIGVNYSDDIVKGDYVVFNGGEALPISNLKIPSNLINGFTKQEILKNNNKAEQNTDIIISSGILKPKSRYKILDLINNESIKIQNIFNNQYFNNNKYMLKNLLGEETLIDFITLYNSQGRVRAFATINNLNINSVENITVKNKLGYDVTIGLKYTIFNKLNNKSIILNIKFEDNEQHTDLLSLIPNYKINLKKLIKPSYVGSTHSFQGVGITNTLVNAQNILQYINSENVNLLDILSSFYTAITRTKSVLGIIVNQKTNTDNFNGFTQDITVNNIENNNLPDSEFDTETC